MTLPLRPYQEEGVAFLRREGGAGAILADEMGLGKSRSVLEAARGARRLCIICPSHVRGVWRSELAKWRPELRPFFAEGVVPNKKRAVALPPADDFDVVVCHYDILHAWAVQLAGWAPEVLVFDEGHALQNERSRRSEAARQVRKASNFCWALTGTPLTNRPKDLWNLADTVRPKSLGRSFFSFGCRFCNGHQIQVTPEKVVWDFKGKSNLPELRALLARFCLRRTVADVALQLPGKTRQVIYFEGEGTEAGPLADFPPGGLFGTGMRRSLDASADGRLGDVRQHLIDTLDGATDGGVVVFTWRRAVAETLAAVGRLHADMTEMVHGGIPHAERERRLTALRTAGGRRLLVATIDSCATGIDLTWASHGIFAEIDYKPHALLQAEARLHRFGQAAPVLIQYLLTRGTVDEVVAQFVIDKLETYGEVLGDGGGEGALATALSGSEDDLMAELMRGVEAMKQHGGPPEEAPQRQQDDEGD